MKLSLKQQIGNRIKLAREKAGMTQITLAEKISISKQIISDYEHANAFPSIKSATDICRTLSVSLNWLLTGDANMDAKNECDYEFSEDEIRLITAYRKAPKHKKEIALEILEKITQPKDRKRHSENKQNK